MTAAAPLVAPTPADLARLFADRKAAEAAVALADADDYPTEADFTGRLIYTDKHGSLRFAAPFEARLEFVADGLWRAVVAPVWLTLHRWAMARLAHRPATTSTAR